MRRVAHLVTIAFLAAAVPAGAEEVRLTAEFFADYDQEVVSDKDDFSFEFGPTLRINGEHAGRFTYSVRHRSLYEKFVTFSEFDDWRHDLQVQAAVVLSPRAEFRIAESFSAVPRIGVLNREDISGPDPDPTQPTPVLDDLGNSELRTNNFSMTLSTQPTARLSTSSNFSHFFRQTDQTSLSSQDTAAITFSQQVFYQLARQHQLGVGFSLRDRQFDAGGNQEATTLTYQAFGIWNYQYDGRTSFSAQAGPAWATDNPEDPSFSRYLLDPTDNTQLLDPSTCPLGFAVVGGFVVPVALLAASCDPIAQRPLTASEVTLLQDLEPMFAAGTEQEEAKNDTNVNVFFAFRASRTFDRGELFTDWTRSDSLTEGLGSATIIDTFRVGVRWRFTSRLRAGVTFRFTRRDTDVDNEFETPFFAPVATLITEIPAMDVFGGLLLGTSLSQQQFEVINDIYSLQLNMSWEYSDSVTFIATTSGRQQESRFQTELQDTRTENEDFTVRIGLNYRFRPFRL